MAEWQCKQCKQYNPDEEESCDQCLAPRVSSGPRETCRTCLHRHSTGRSCHVFVADRKSRESKAKVIQSWRVVCMSVSIVYLPGYAVDVCGSSIYIFPKIPGIWCQVPVRTYTLFKCRCSSNADRENDIYMRKHAVAYYCGGGRASSSSGRAACYYACLRLPYRRQDN